MRTLGIFIFLATLAPTLALAQDLRLTLAAQPTDSNVISTRRARDLILSASSGHRVSFARQSGRDYRLQGSGGLVWTQVQELPRDAEAVVIMPTLQEDGSIRIELDVFRKEDTREQRYSSTISAQPGEWVQLYGPAHSASSPRATVYGTRQVSAESLFLRVDPQSTP